MWTKNFQMYKLCLENAEELEIANIRWTIKKTREFQKKIYVCFTDSTKAFDCVDQNCEKFLNSWEYQTTLPASWETCMQVKSNS